MTPPRAHAEEIVLRKSDLLILDRAEQDLEEGIRFKVKRIRASGHPLLARAMEAGVAGAMSAIQLRQRFRDDVRFVLGLAHRVNAGEDPKALADEHVERVLRMRELGLVVRRDDPAFPRVLEMNRDFLARRLPDLARMSAVDDPVDYVDVVRRAFPDRREVDGIVAENAAFVLALVEHVKTHPHLLRVPRAWLPKLEQVARDIVDWQVARVGQALDEIYAPEAR